MIEAAIALFIFIFTIVLQLIVTSFVYPMPLTDSGTVRYRTVPYVTMLLIVVNSLVFMIWQAPNLYQGSQIWEEDGYSFNSPGYDMLDDYVQQVWTYGFRTSYMREAKSIGSFTTFTAMFMHADLWHLLGNMIFLWAFGRRVEDACGSWRFLLFYLLAGMIAHLGAGVLNPTVLDRPSIGASGAISGVMGAYLLLFPSAQVNCIWGLGSILRYPITAFAHVIGSPRSLKEAPLWRWTIRLPAWLVLLDFLAQQIIPSFEVLQHQRDLAGVNTLAHLVGFLAALAIILFARKDLVLRFFSGRSV